jgi:hypothetical protein
MDGLYGWDYPSFDRPQGLDTLSSPEDGTFDFSRNTPVLSIYYCCENFGQNGLPIFEILMQSKCQSKF